MLRPMIPLLLPARLLLDVSSLAWLLLLLMVGGLRVAMLGCIGVRSGATPNLQFRLTGAQCKADGCCRAVRYNTVRSVL